MEAVAAVASVTGIIAFVIQALKAAESLKDFCQEFSEDTAKEFTSNLESSVSLLLDVKDLCERVQHAIPATRTDLRLSSLQIQIEDCTKDLESWWELALRMKGHKNWANSSRSRAFTRFLNATNKSSRMFFVFTERRKMYGRPAYRLAYRQFDLNNSVLLQNMDLSMQKIRRRQSNDKRELHDILDQISSSGSSMLAHSKSTEEQLSSLSAEIQSVKDILLEVLPSHSWASNAPAAESEARESAFIPDNPFESREENEVDDDSDEADESVPPLSPLMLRIPTEPITDNPHEPEFEALFATAKSLVNTVSNLFHPLVAEYISIVNSWRIGEMEQACLAMEPSLRGWLRDDVDEEAILTVVGRQLKFIDRLLSLRKTCHREGLNESLEAIDAKFGVDGLTIDSWEIDIERWNSTQKKLNLERLGYRDPSELKSDKLTFLNEWMLGVVQSDPSLIAFHRAMYTEISGKRNVELSIETGLGQPHSPTDGTLTLLTGNITSMSQPAHPNLGLDESWYRKMLKFWFLDSAAMTHKEYASSSIATTETDVTVVPVDPVIDIDFLDVGVSVATEVETVKIIRQPGYSAFRRTSEDRRMLDEATNAAPEHASKVDIIAAKRAREVYARQAASLHSDQSQ
ncbi:hypothetical protein AJ80_05284 [Polytolypa hystricis UAMH7299]|uniref:Fungal N-terminal domain-containing protein n=1 Tax=Polytolypa hystricis (strain UAMH7299) TaxID=1447883 RepID=A0A2B7Y5H7_POLH7|nr:hypothetical protein AJ80_05284 [Polytolypa hystricis UAMH7299]